jgi:hypothetical protein
MGVRFFAMLFLAGVWRQGFRTPANPPSKPYKMNRVLTPSGASHLALAFWAQSV